MTTTPAGKFPYRRALVTGGAGFIGSHIIEALLGLGVETVSVDSYIAGVPENLKDLPNRHLLQEEKCDVTDAARFRALFKGVDVVFHNAASKKVVCLKDPRVDLRVNAEGAYNVMEFSREFGVKKVVHASTGSVYGKAVKFPQDEDHPLRPTSYYGVSKLAGEQYVLAFNHLYGIDTSVIRYFHVYGSRQESADDRGGVVAIFARRALAGLPLTIFGDGTQERSFTYVKDVVRANLLVATDPRSRGQVYNCASGLKITVKELADKTRRLCGHPDLGINYADWTPGDVKEFDVDHRKIEALGFKGWTGFDEGLKETLDWYRRH